MRSIFIFLIILTAIFFQFNNALAVAPQPSEIERKIEIKSFEKVKHAESDTICNVLVSSAGDITHNKSPQKESLSFAFDKSVVKKDVFKEILRLIEEDIKGENIIKVSIECNFKK
jgi:outer membrane protein OmpA-like peptidoglycan-associated protein